MSSIRLQGVLQPLVVRRAGTAYQLVCGYRRLLAARAAGLEEVPAVVASLEDAEAIRIHLSENLSRQEVAHDELEATLRILRELRDRTGREEETAGSKATSSDARETGDPGEREAEVMPAEPGGRPLEDGPGEGELDTRVAELLERTRDFFATVRERRRMEMAAAEDLVEELLALPDDVRPLHAGQIYRYPSRCWIAQHALLVASLNAELSPEEPTALGKRGYAIAGLVHDVGMVFLDGFYLTGPRRVLAYRQRRELQSHTRIGHALISAAGKDWAEVAVAARDHHERLDGSGYPNGFRGDQLGQLVRLTGLVDSYASMVGRRPWRKPLAASVALERLRRAAEMGLYDPKLLRRLDVAVRPSGRRQWAEATASDLPRDGDSAPISGRAAPINPAFPAEFY